MATTSVVAVSDDLASKIINHDVDAAEQCVKEVNQFPDDTLDTSSRLYQAGMCYFCIDCNLAEDNGQLFQLDALNNGADNNPDLSESYQTAKKLMTQAAGLGNEKAYYALAVMAYYSGLTKNKKTKTKLSKDRISEFKIKVEQEKLSDKEIKQSIDRINKRTFEKMNKDGFSLEIHENLLMAAKRGYLPAQFALSEAYFKGIGVTPDPLQAYAWAATAVAQNPPFGSLRRDEKAVNLDEVEINQAEAMAEKYMKSYTNIFDRSSVTVMR